MSAGLYLFFVFLYLFLSVICLYLLKIKNLLELMQIEQKIMIGDSVRTNKRLMDYFNLFQ